MQIQVNTSNGIENKETLEAWADTQLKSTLARFVDDVTRVEIHLSDENSDKKHGADKRCVMEARLAKHQPVAVNHTADTVDEAFRGAEGKLKRLIESTLGRLEHHRDRESIRKNAMPE
ncbi:MAG: HPF/RaiA family ribosome-associated protein [Variovorax sp.]